MEEKSKTRGTSETYLNYARKIEAGTYIENQTIQRSQFFTRGWGKPNETPPNALPSELISRAPQLTELHKRLIAKSRVAITGIEGVGKRTLAILYAQEYAASFYEDGILWVTPDKLETTLNQWGQHAYQSDPRAHIQGADGQTSPFTFENVKQLLSNVANLLVVFDRVDTYDDISHLVEILPSRAHILLVTNSQLSADDSFDIFSLSLLDPEESVEFLSHRLPGLSIDLLSKLAGHARHNLKALELVVGQLKETEKRELEANKLLENQFDLESLVQDFFANSYSELEDQQQRELRLLGIFGDEFIKFDVELVAAIWEMDISTATEKLDDFAKRSFISSSNQLWFQHISIRDFCRVRLIESADYKDAYERYLNHLTDYTSLFFDQLVSDWEQKPHYVSHIQYMADSITTNLTSPLFPDFIELECEFMVTLLPYIHRYLPFSIKGLEWLKTTLTLSKKIDVQEAIEISSFLLGIRYLHEGSFKEGLETFKSLKNLDNHPEPIVNQAVLMTNFARCQRGLGKTDQAIQSLREALILIEAKQIPQIGLKAQTLMSLGELLIFTLKFEEAFKYLEEAISLTEQITDVDVRFDILQTYIILSDRLGFHKSALEGVEESEDLLKRYPSKTWEAIVANNRGYILLSLDSYDEALESFEKGMALTNEIGFYRLQGTLLNNIGLLYQETNRLAEAEDTLLKAKELIEESVNPEVMSRILVNLGGVAYSSGRLNEALIYLQEALPLLRHMQDRKYMMETLYMIGMIYKAKGNLQDGIAFFKEAQQILKVIGDQTGVFTASSWIALLFYGVGDTEEAVKLVEEILPTIEGIQNISERAPAMHTLGQIYVAMGQFQKASDVYSTITESLDRIGNKQLQADILIGQANLYLRLDQTDKAIEVAEYSLNIAKNSHSQPEQAKALILLSIISTNRRKFEDVGKYLAQANAIAKSIDDKLLFISIENGYGLYHMGTGEYEKAQIHFEQSLVYMTEIQNFYLEPTILSNLAVLSFDNLKQPTKGIDYMEQAIQSMERQGLEIDAAGQSIELMQHIRSVLEEESEEYLPRTSYESYAEAVNRLLQCVNWQEIETILKINAKLLSGQKADELLAQQIKKNKDQLVDQILRFKRRLLNVCREQDVSEALQAIKGQERAFLYHWWGRLERGRRQYGRSLIHYNRAIELSNSNSQLMVERGWTYRGLGNNDRAKEDFAQALEMNRSNSDSLLGQGVLAFEQRLFEDALDYFDQAIDISDKDPFYFQWRGAANHELKNIEKALADYDQAIFLNRRESAHYYWRALVLIDDGQYRNALDDLNRVCELDKDEPIKLGHDLIWRGIVHRLMKRQDQMNSDWERVDRLVKESVDGPPLELCQMMLYIVREQFSEGLELLRLILLKNPSKHLLKTQSRHIYQIMRLYMRTPDSKSPREWHEVYNHFKLI